VGTLPQVFLEAQPGLPWFETFESFRAREGCPDLDFFEDWYAEKMGSRSPPRRSLDQLPHLK